MKKNTRLHKNILNNIDSYFLWGKKIIQVIKEYLEDTKNLCFYGHPKFDLLKKKIFNFTKKK